MSGGRCVPDRKEADENQNSFDGGDALPVVGTAAGAGGARYDDRHISAGQKADIKASNAILKRATNADHTVLNYAKAKANDKGRTTARRKFAAAFEWRGGRITHISVAEHAKVRAYYRGKPAWRSINGGPSPAVAGTNGQVSRLARNCRGRSDVTGDINIAAGRSTSTTGWTV